MSVLVTVCFVPYEHSDEHSVFTSQGWDERDAELAEEGITNLNLIFTAN